jgi:hypothetical protein
MMGWRFMEAQDKNNKRIGTMKIIMRLSFFE